MDHVCRSCSGDFATEVTFARCREIFVVANVCFIGLCQSCAQRRLSTLDGTSYAAACCVGWHHLRHTNQLLFCDFMQALVLVLERTLVRAKTKQHKMGERGVPKKAVGLFTHEESVRHTKTDKTFWASEKHRESIGKASEKHRKSIGKASEKHRESIGKASEKHRKSIGKASEKHRKTDKTCHGTGTIHKRIQQSLAATVTCHCFTNLATFLRPSQNTSQPTEAQVGTMIWRHDVTILLLIPRHQHTMPISDSGNPHCEPSVRFLAMPYFRWISDSAISRVSAVATLMTLPRLLQCSLLTSPSAIPSVGSLR
eukprot:SAG31_NODE_3343_length_4381_cov_12.838393_5_plen_312_part_00